ncbi:MAG: YibE/F family protein [Elusimicrobiota bacterium]
MLKIIKKFPIYNKTAVAIILSLSVFFWADNVNAYSKNRNTFVRARVIEISDKVPPEFESTQKVKVKILSGKLKDEVVVADNFINSYEGYNTQVKKGRKVILKITDPGKSTQTINVEDYYRAPYLFYSLLLFIIIFLAVVGWKNKNVLMVVLLNFILIIFVLLPLIKIGFSPLVSTILVVGFGIFVSIYIIFGPGRKLTAATMGAIIGIASAGILTLISLDYFHLSGFFSREARMLLLVSRHLDGWNITDLNGLMAAGIMVASMGAVMDIAVTVTSASKNIADQTESITASRVLAAGMNVGRDVISTMINSLILVFTGIALPLIGVFEILDIQLYRVINFEFFAVLILSAIISSTALVLTVPVTALINSWIFKE